MKILVTGGCGLVGRWTIQALLKKGHDVRVIDLDTKRNRRILRKTTKFGHVETIFGSITNKEIVNNAVAETNAILHNAAILWPQSEENPELSHRVNVEGTEILLAAAKRHSSKVVFSSSVSIYGADKERVPPLTLKHPVSPSDHYSKQKILC